MQKSPKETLWIFRDLQCLAQLASALNRICMAGHTTLPNQERMRLKVVNAFEASNDSEPCEIENNMTNCWQMSLFLNQKYSPHLRFPSSESCWWTCYRLALGICIQHGISLAHSCLSRVLFAWHSVQTARLCYLQARTVLPLQSRLRRRSLYQRQAYDCSARPAG